VSGLIINNTNRVLWVVFGTGTATAAAPNISVPVGGNIDIPDGYVGAVQGICAGAASNLSGSIQVTEFT
jgi:hypothetical protein